MHPLAQTLILGAISGLFYGFLLGLVRVAAALVFRRRLRPASAGGPRPRPAAGGSRPAAAGESGTLPPSDFMEANFASGDRDTITGQRFEIGDPVAQCAACYAVYSILGRALLGASNGDRCVRCNAGAFWQTTYLEPFTGQPGRHAPGVSGQRPSAARPPAEADQAATVGGGARSERGARPAYLLRGAILALVGGIVASALYLNQGTPSLAEIRDIVGRPTVEVRRVNGAIVFGEQVYPVPVEIADMPDFLKSAIIEIEDRRFHWHLGIDPIAVMTVLWDSLRSRLSGQPARLRGGSTITQQVAKNVFLTSDWSYLRKLRESWLAMKLSVALSKDEVLELYLNRIFMGGANYGIELAARDYFGVRARSLNKYQIAILAGIISRPNRANPRHDTKAAHERARIVLATLESRGRITAAERDRLMRRWHGRSFSVLRTGTRTVPRIERGWIEDWLRRELETARYVGQQPVRLVLSIDPLAQVYAELAARRLAEHGRTNGGYDSLAVVVLSPDGGIRALVGGANRRLNQFNNAVLARRPMASTFKPIVYLSALSSGLTPQSTVIDQPIMFEGRPYPRNFAGGYRGAVTVAEALRMSLNAAAVRLCDTAGKRRRVIELARRFGLHGPFADGPSLALGAVAATPVEVASAYATFANGGYRTEAWAVAAAQGLNGRMTYQRPPQRRRRAVAEPRHIGAINRMLNAAATKGTGRGGAFSRNIAGKTGTSQDSRDAWFAGYTRDLVAVIWVGNRDNRRTRGVTGGGMPASAFGNLMANIQDGQVPSPPPGVR